MKKIKKYKKQSTALEKNAVLTNQRTEGQYLIFTNTEYHFFNKISVLLQSIDILETGITRRCYRGI